MGENLMILPAAYNPNRVWSLVCSISISWFHVPWCPAPLQFSNVDKQYQVFNFLHSRVMWFCVLDVTNISHLFGCFVQLHSLSRTQKHLLSKPVCNYKHLAFTLEKLYLKTLPTSIFKCSKFLHAVLFCSGTILDKRYSEFWRSVL